MPRARVSGTAPPNELSDSPRFFDSLKALAEWSRTPRVRSLNRNRVPFGSSTPPDLSIPRLIVCHDYKGGYSENDRERGYSFQFWHLCDVYIYFSHHRVSLPPAAFVNTSHRHGTRVFGTLIFEWDAGRADILELVRPGEEEETVRFDQFDTRYADWLVDLAVEGGIDGWLVNVEVELGGRREQAGKGRLGAKDHAQLLIFWLSYFKKQMHRRLPGSEVMWYDAVTIEGDLRWQSAINELNCDFLLACDSIFLNYHWSIEELKSTREFLSQNLALVAEPGRICFGIDVFGRGTYGGGGFQTWRGIEAITENSNFSTALFAPGWTVESEDLSHSLITKGDHSKWLQDEMFLWLNGPATPRVPSELARMQKLYRDQAGSSRARLLAHALRRDLPVPIAYRAPIEPVSFDLSSVDVPNDDHRSIASFFRTHPMRPTDDSFYTNFSSGSGHSFSIQGQQVESTPTGFTDVDYTFPFPYLLLDAADQGIEASFTEEAGDVWEGERSVKIHVDPSKFKKDTIDIIALDFPTTPNRGCYYAKMTYKCLEGSHDQRRENDRSDSGFVPIVRLYSGSGHREDQLEHDNIETEVPKDATSWGSTTTTFVTKDSTRITKIAISIGKGSSSSSFVMGSLAIWSGSTGEPTKTTKTAVIKPDIDGLAYTEETCSLEWTTRYRVASTTRVAHLDSRPSSHPDGLPSFVQYHLYRRSKQPRRGDERDRKTELEPRDADLVVEEWLGTTRENRFRIARDVLVGYEISVRGVEASGEMTGQYVDLFRE